MKRTFIAVAVLLLFSNCGIVDIDENLNRSPNSPSEASAPQLMANAMLSLPGLSSSPNGNFMGQYLSETTYVLESLYPDGSTSFYGWYQGPLINLQTVLETSTVDNQLAVSKILKAYYMWNLTDRWGDLPYSEALQGSANFTPAYDRQEDIYNDLFALLREAHDQINTSLSLSSDIMYNGNMTRWQKFANTVRMLMALRLSEVNPSLAQSEFNAALNAGVMESNNDSFVYRHLADANNQNYWYGQIEVSAREWWALPTHFIEMMEPVDDPRLEVYGDPARASGDYVGMPFGLADEDALSTEAYSLLGEDIRAQDAPVYLVTYAQSLFARAEAAQRGWTGENAEELYNSAVQNSVFQWTGSVSGVADLLAHPDVAYDGTIERIAEQRHVHLFMHGYEAWAEWRRTGYPDNRVQPAGRAVPTRLAYPANEEFNNTANYEEAIQRQFGGEDNLYGNVWWDVN